MNNTETIINCELTVLGTIINYNDYFLKTIDILTKDDFYKDSHKILYDMIKQLYENDVEVNMLTLKENLKDYMELGKIKGTEIIQASTYEDRHTFNSALKLIKEESNKRKILSTIKSIANSNLSSIDMLDKLDELQSIRSKEKKNRIMDIKEVCINNLDKIDEAYKNKSGITGIETGINQLNLSINGLCRKQLNIIAARPSCGKTAFSLKLLNNIKGNVLYIQSDMSVNAMINRMISTETHINSMKISTAQLNSDEWDKVALANGRISRKENLHFIETDAITIAEIKQKVKELKTKNKIDVLIVDHIGKIKSTTKGSRYEQMTVISNELKRIAIEFDINVTALCQLSRGCEQRGDKHPMLSDLRDTGAIEEDADNILLLYRDGYYNELEPGQNDVLEVEIAKARDGLTCVMNFEYILSTQELIEIIE